MFKCGKIIITLSKVFTINMRTKLKVIIPMNRPISMMTSSNGYIFRVTGPLCGEFTVSGEFPTHKPVTRIFDVFFGLRLNKRLSKQPWGWWFETLSWSLWRQYNVTQTMPAFGIEGTLTPNAGIGRLIKPAAVENMTLPLKSKKFCHDYLPRLCYGVVMTYYWDIAW